MLPTVASVRLLLALAPIVAFVVTFCAAVTR